MEKQSITELNVFVAQGNIQAKRELARRLVDGEGVDKDEAKAVSLLQECVALGYTDAMLMLAKCCALGWGMEQNARRAETLVSDAAKRKNKEAQSLTKLINDWKGKERIDLSGLFMNRSIFTLFVHHLSVL